MASRDPRIFTIPASAPFLDVLITTLLDRRLVPGFPAASDDPLRLAAATLYLPTRRACRLARDAFLDALGTDAAILPRIVAIGDVDEDELGFAEAATAGLGEAALDLPVALGGLERRLLLARLIGQWAASPAARGQAGAPLIANTPAAAVALADDLARLIDDMTTRRVGWERLDGLVPDNVDDYWQKTLSFLQFIRGHWSDILTERGTIEPAARRDLLIEAERTRLALAPGPVIAAGSTGSMPTTAALLATIAGLPHGAVVLPGLDTDLDENAWRLIGGRSDPSRRDEPDPASGHPQFAMHGLLRRLEVNRDAVTVLAGPQPHGRERLLSEALRPAAATDLWQHRLADSGVAGHVAAAVESLSVVEAANAEEEALAVAIALREASEDPRKTVALITPDRSLARRVLAALERWHVPVDDSGGDALPDTPAGVFTRLAADVALNGVEPVPLLALLKHPLLRLGAGEGAHGYAVAALERAILRGPRPSPGTDGLKRALSDFGPMRDKLHRRDPRRFVSDRAIGAAAGLVDRLAAALAPLERFGDAPQPFDALMAAHRDVVTMLSDGGDGLCAAFAGEDGTKLDAAFDEGVADGAAASFVVRRADYSELFRAALGDRVVRRPEVAGVRVRILGPLESRLQTFDRVVLGGLVEGIWPPEARSDPWLSRPMRHDLGLDLPERRVGLSAHDFAQALGAREVVLTRAARVAGAPTVASRFVQRLAAVAGADRWRQAIERGGRYLALARRLDEPAQRIRFERPTPKPPIAARPNQMSVTDVENWLRDPYTIYAKHILRLPVLDAVDTPPGAADRGTVIHEAIGKFTAFYAEALPDDPLTALIEIGRREFAPLEAFPEARAFWWPRFLRIAKWFVDWEIKRRRLIRTLLAEKQGRAEFPIGERTFYLTARADRIERLTDGRLAILDYKTGRPPGHEEVKAGLAPQLTLEAAILRDGGFTDVPAGLSVAELVYVSLRGGEPPGENREVRLKDSTPDAEADRAFAKLKALALRFEDEAQGYASLVHPQFRKCYGDYDHLARVKEWSATGGEIEDGIPE
jgi:ATP-dependent helicase/nuclease subunit B